MSDSRERALTGELEAAVTDRRAVFVAGLPGTGKSLLVRRLASVAAAAGRRVSLLQWDVARLAFDDRDRYPEADGVTHPAIRVAVGMWARDAVARWERAHGDGADLLIGETPLVGERLMSLARPARDGVEAFLASDRALFLIPTPTAEVRAAIERSRASDVAGGRDRASAAPHLVVAGWSELADVARRFGIRAGAAYDTDAYVAVYRRVLRHRRSAALRIAVVLPVPSDAHAAPASHIDVVPSAADVTDFMSRAESLPPGEIDRLATRWYEV